MTATITVGVLALQGAFAEHLAHLARAAALPALAPYSLQFLAVRTAAQLAQCDGLIIPGGESTAMSLIAERTGMLEPLRDFAAAKPVWGTCAGLIFLASEIHHARPHQRALGALAVAVARNAFGRQLDLFDAARDFAPFAPAVGRFRTVFIRAPVVCAVRDGAKWRAVGPESQPSALAPAALPAALPANVVVSAPCTNSAPVEVLHTLENGLVVAVRQGHVLGTSFHPELADDCRFHAWFVEEFVVRRIESDS